MDCKPREGRFWRTALSEACGLARRPSYWRVKTSSSALSSPALARSVSWRVRS